MVDQRKLTKNERKRLKAKEKKIVLKSTDSSEDDKKTTKKEETIDDLDIEIEYVSSNPLEDIQDASILQQFKSVFEKFAKPEELLTAKDEEAKEDEAKEVEDGGRTKTRDEAEEVAPVKLSKKKKKLMNRLSVAELKQLVQRPDVVEAHDVTSSDPRLLVFLKAYRNTVPVPRHWCAKRKYLQGKRGVEKPPFQLPEYIADTGIAKIRDAVLEQEAQRKSKQKNRERVQPKTGKIDIDYQVLHDAFFKYQTKPKLTGHGDLYYEGKEFEVNSCYNFFTFL
jgi:splicing factor 3B subunit 2